LAQETNQSSAVVVGFGVPFSFSAIASEQQQQGGRQPVEWTHFIIRCGVDDNK
jgi:hypothetical protein